MLPDKGDARPPFTGRWQGGTVICLASGPSLCDEDIERVSRWRAEEARSQAKAVIVANTTFRAAPWADALFAIDRDWWKTYINEINATFKGERYSKNSQNPSYNVTQLKELNTYGNSGAGCISVAEQAGAARVILLGFDCGHTGGKSHWHGDHPSGLGNAGLTYQWLDKFKQLAHDFSHVEIINASRETAITCFPRARLEDLI